MNAPTNEGQHVAPDMDLLTFYRTTSAMGKEAMWRKKAEGETMHLAPLGYLNARDADGRSITVVDPKTFPLVQEAKRMRRDGATLQTICATLKEKGLRSKRGKVIGLSSLLKILNHPPL